MIIFHKNSNGNPLPPNVKQISPSNISKYENNNAGYLSYKNSSKEPLPPNHKQSSSSNIAIYNFDKSRKKPDYSPGEELKDYKSKIFWPKNSSEKILLFFHTKTHPIFFIIFHPKTPPKFLI